MHFLKYSNYSISTSIVDPYFDENHRTLHITLLTHAKITGGIEDMHSTNTFYSSMKYLLACARKSPLSIAGHGRQI